MEEEKKKIDYIEKIDEYLEKKFFREDDRKISCLAGRYYNYMAFLEKSVLKTHSLLTKLPMYTKRMDRDQILKIIEKCNSVANRLISKNKSTSGTGGILREKINEFLAEDIWKSSHHELAIAFMMGFSLYIPINKETKESE